MIHFYFSVIFLLKKIKKSQLHTILRILIFSLRKTFTIFYVYIIKLFVDVCRVVDENHKSFGETRIDKISILREQTLVFRSFYYDECRVRIFLFLIFTMVFGINLISSRRIKVYFIFVRDKKKAIVFSFVKNTFISCNKSKLTCYTMDNSDVISLND